MKQMRGPTTPSTSPPTGTNDMGKILETKINTFGTGMVHDKRHRDPSASTLAKNFDLLTYPHKLVPHFTKQDGNANQNTEEIDNFLFAVGKLYGLGKDQTASGPENIQLYASESFSSDDWTEPNNSQGDANPTDAYKDFFLHYKFGGVDYLYGVYDNEFWRYNITAGSIDNSNHSLTFSAIGQGLVHSKDDIMYVPYVDANGVPKIAKNNANSWTDVAITLPAGGYISAICEYGNYLAIAWSPSSVFSNTSKVYLWNRDSSLTTLDEKIDFGYGEIKVLEELQGELLAVQQISSTLIFNSQIIVRRYAGFAGAQEVAKLIGSSATCDVRARKQKKNNRLYFLATITLEGTKQQGVWSLGRSEEGAYCLSLEHTPNNDTALSGETLRGFFLGGDYVFITYDESGTFAMRKTQQNIYTQSSTWQSTIIDDEDVEDASVYKKLLRVIVTTEPLPTDGQVVVKYRINAESSYTTIFTLTTNDAVGYCATNIESTGANLPEYNEIQFQIISTGGAVPTGFSFQREILDKRK